jgi:DHA2 family multidrug resistance protein
MNQAAAISMPPVPRWLGYIAACVGMFMAILDIQVVVTSLPVIEKALNIGANLMSWVQTSYLIAEVIAIPLTGLLMRVFGMRHLFAVALTIFTLASLGCAASSGFIDLLLWRVLQGAAGGVLIPMVFSGIFLLFPRGLQQTAATTLGGVLAVLAPTLGPIAGGWITEHYTWHWLFLINAGPGLLALIVGMLFLPRGELRLQLLVGLDWLSLALLGVGLAVLIIGLKEAPTEGWASTYVLLCFGVVLICGIWLWQRPKPAIMFYLLKDRPLLFGCILSFILGFALFGSVYLMPIFLAFVRGHGPLQIGLTIMVGGVSQLIIAPVTVWLDRRFNARILAALGFLVFGIGLAMNATLDTSSDYDALFWPQVVRGIAVGLCILPPIRFALAFMSTEQVGDGSGLFNVARNIGGAIGIALIDTVIFMRGPDHVSALMDLMKSNPDAAAKLMGVDVSELPAPGDPTGLMGIMDQVQAAALTQAVNESWWMLAGVCLLALPVLALLGPIRAAMAPTKLNPSV